MRHFRTALVLVGSLIVTTPDRAPAQVCPIEAPGNCQSGSSCTSYLSSDRALGTRSADDFQPVGDTISRVCFAPCFRGFTATTSYNCDGTAPNRGTPPPDDFIMKIYEEDFGKPGPMLAGIPVGGLALTIDAKAPITSCTTSYCWQYTAPVNPPTGIAVEPGECYWLEITGLGEVQAQGTCYVYWQTATPGNRYVFRDYDNEYTYDDIQLSDLSYCLDSGIAVATAPPNSLDGGCGTRPVACCPKFGACADGIPLAECLAEEGFVFQNATCADPEVADFCAAPPNDLCADAINLTDCMLNNPGPAGWCSIPWWIPQYQYELCDPMMQDCLDPTATCLPFDPARETYRCVFPVDNIQALTDGPSIFGTSCFSKSHFESDIWYTFVAPCSGKVVVDGCPDQVGFDSMLLLYGDHTSTCQPCPITNNQFDLVCQDDTCRFLSGPAAAGASITQGACYTIRFGGWSQLGSPADAGQGVGTQTLSVICNPPPGPATPTIPSGNVLKNRYISFVPMDGPNTSAFRVAVHGFTGRKAELMVWVGRGSMR